MNPYVVWKAQIYLPFSMCPFLKKNIFLIIDVRKYSSILQQVLLPSLFQSPGTPLVPRLPLLHHLDAHMQNTVFLYRVKLGLSDRHQDCTLSLKMLWTLECRWVRYACWPKLPLHHTQIGGSTNDTLPVLTPASSSPPRVFQSPSRRFQYKSGLRSGSQKALLKLSREINRPRQIRIWLRIQQRSFTVSHSYYVPTFHPLLSIPPHNILTFTASLLTFPGYGSWIRLIIGPFRPILLKMWLSESCSSHEGGNIPLLWSVDRAASDSLWGNWMTGEIHIRTGLMIKTGLTEKRFLSGRCCHLFFLLCKVLFSPWPLKLNQSCKVCNVWLRGWRVWRHTLEQTTDFQGNIN